jgi:hypothetical protein
LTTLFCSGLAGQFPPPVSFQFSYEYIMIDEWGVCKDSTIYGPAYCSHFTWSPPDTSQTGARLEYYRIYQDAFPLVSVADTFYHTVGGFIGRLYVTAVYSNPEGESDSSNVVYSEALPIFYGFRTGRDRTSIYYQKQGKMLVVPGHRDLVSLRLYDIMGREIRSFTPVGSPLSVPGLRPGLYLIRTEAGNGRVRVQKVLVE